MRAVAVVGPARLALTDVARETGLAPATLLQRFGSKRGMLLAALERMGVEGSSGPEQCGQSPRLGWGRSWRRRWNSPPPTTRPRRSPTGSRFSMVSWMIRRCTGSRSSGRGEGSLGIARSSTRRLPRVSWPRWMRGGSRGVSTRRSAGRCSSGWCIVRDRSRRGYGRRLRGAGAVPAARGGGEGRGRPAAGPRARHKL